MQNAVYIYTLSCPVTGHVRYVGKTEDLTRRMKSHLRTNDRPPTHKSCWIKSLQLNGLLPVIEIIDEVQQSDWEFWEQHYISLFRSWGYKLTNRTNGGEGASGYKASEETRKKMSAVLMGNKRTLGYKQSEETKRKVSEAHKGKQFSLGYRHTKEALKKISEAHKGNKYCLGIKQSEEVIRNRTLKIRGKVRSPEAVEKLRVRSLGNKYNLGKHLTEDTKKKIGDAHRGEKNYWYGKTRSEEWKEQMSERNKKNPVKYWLGKKMPEAVRIKMSESRKGTNNPMYGKKTSEETKEKQRLAHAKRKLQKTK